MSRILPSLNALKAFEAAARHESFTLAAAELNVTHAAISRHIRELEVWLGTKLFVRTGRGVELTEKGGSYVADITRGFDVLAAATESVSSRRRRRRQQLVVSVEPSFAALWLVPRLGRFTAANPEIELVVDSSHRLVDFARDEADIGIRYGRGVWPNVASDVLTRTNMTPVCSPALLRARRIREPSDLEPGLLLQEETRRYWYEWLKAAGVCDRISPEGPTLGLHLTIPAAEAGQGFALADEVIAGDALVGGRLVKPFAISVAEYGYYFVRDAARKDSKAMAAFHAWLKAEIDQTVDAVRKLAAPARRPAVSKKKR
ncbi:transcriptional regulator GcvA [Hyphomicrobium sp. LHD-15]|uniref:transcriptional regulator GcvA n=1 Tax=Hyphomicrobium sp. LHD-15 TaxID=3072142 RepID=UPI00280D59A6|nr:transcriptional regulator GcvA [Hyphomicrobium sp. LHD-15]MDQ8699975.1 transcriptional regulator GcvA [Hyphomicrobium sp. LHD-15]